MKDVMPKWERVCAVGSELAAAYRILYQAGEITEAEYAMAVELSIDVIRLARVLLSNNLKRGRQKEESRRV